MSWGAVKIDSEEEAETHPAAKDIPTNKCNGYGGCCRGVIL